MITFHPNCTLPSQTPAFVAGANVRSSLDIVWSCVSVLILCSWSILHLNVPAQYHPNNWKQSLRRKIHFFWSKLFWMFIMLIAPEVMIAKAFSYFVSARHHTKLFQEITARDRVSWTQAHSFFADMGGFAVRFRLPPHLEERTGEPEIELPLLNEATPGVDERTNPDEPQQPFPVEKRNLIQKLVGPFWETHDIQALRIRSQEFKSNIDAASALYGPAGWKRHHNHTTYVLEALPQLLQDLHEDNTSNMAVFPLEGHVWTLTAAQLYQARERNIIDRLPVVSEDDICDKSKEDALIKAGALIQVSWMAIQLLERAISHKSSTPLEIMTLAFAVCALLIYGLLWNRPKDIATRIYIQANEGAVSADVIRELVLYGPSFFINDFGANEDRISNNAIPTLWGLDYTSLLVKLRYNWALALGSALFGGLHLIAWNLQFPTTLEQILWQIASLITTLGPIAMLTIGYFVLALKAKSNCWDALGYAIIFPIFVSLILARLYLLTESFRSLYFLPPDVYEATWTTNIPHIG